jgi:hypothetical protein
MIHSGATRRVFCVAAGARTACVLGGGGAGAHLAEVAVDAGVSEASLPPSRRPHTRLAAVDRCKLPANAFARKAFRLHCHSHARSPCARIGISCGVSWLSC